MCWISKHHGCVPPPTVFRLWQRISGPVEPDRVKIKISKGRECIARGLYIGSVITLLLLSNILQP